MGCHCLLLYPLLADSNCVNLGWDAGIYIFMNVSDDYDLQPGLVILV